MTTTTNTPSSTDEAQPKRIAVPAKGRSKGALATYGPPLVVFAIILAGWYLLANYLISIGRTTLLPTPNRIFQDSFTMTQENGQANQPITEDLLRAVGLSLGVALTGLAISIVIGVTWAVLMSQARWVERSLFPYAVILQCVPILALVPLIGTTLGYSFESRILVCVLISLFPMVSNTLFGLQSVERSQRELFRLQNASRWTVLTKLQFPSAMPAIFAGMRISAGLAIVGAIVGDFFFRRGQPGLGILINNYASRVQTPELFAAIITAAVLGVVIFLVFGWIGRLAVGRWYEPAS